MVYILDIYHWCVIINLKGNIMEHTAKIFKNGRSQAVRLPLEYRFDCEEVYIKKDNKTGDIILSQKPTTWAQIFTSIDEIEINESDLVFERENDISINREFMNDK